MCKSIVVIVAFGILAISAISCNEWNKISFNETRWKSDSLTRYKMLDDLIQSKIVLNKTQKEVISILGFPSYKSEINRMWVYNAGAVPEGLGMSFYFLHVHISSDKVDSLNIGKHHD